MEASIKEKIHFPILVVSVFFIWSLFIGLSVKAVYNLNHHLPTRYGEIALFVVFPIAGILTSLWLSINGFHRNIRIQKYTKAEQRRDIKYIIITGIIFILLTIGIIIRVKLGLGTYEQMMGVIFFTAVLSLFIMPIPKRMAGIKKWQ